MNKKSLLIIGVLLVFVVSMGFIVFSKNYFLHNLSNVITVTDSTNTKTTDVTISIRKINSSYFVVLTPNRELVLSGFSMRFYPSQNITFIPNQDLIAANWAFPVNTTYTNESNKLVLDISGINPTETGYGFSKEITLGTINTNSPLTLTLDKGETKILDKSANELEYSYVLK